MSERRNAKIRDQQKVDAGIAREVIEAVMSHPRGRRYMWLRLGEANIFAQTFIPGSPESTAFQEGRRSLGLSLLADITKYAPAAYVQMTKENSSVVFEEEEEADE